jgi:hypothetical protein
LAIGRLRTHCHTVLANSLAVARLRTGKLDGLQVILKCGVGSAECGVPEAEGQEQHAANQQKETKQTEQTKGSRRDWQ